MTASAVAPAVVAPGSELLVAVMEALAHVADVADAYGDTTATDVARAARDEVARTWSLCELLVQLALLDAGPSTNPAREGVAPVALADVVAEALIDLTTPATAPSATIASLLHGLDGAGLAGDLVVVVDVARTPGRWRIASVAAASSPVGVAGGAPAESAVTLPTEAPWRAGDPGTAAATFASVGASRTSLGGIAVHLRVTDGGTPGA